MESKDRTPGVFLMKTLSFSFFLLIAFGCQSIPNPSPNHSSSLFPKDQPTGPIETSIQHLFSPNFLLHSSGAAALIRHGEKSIPYLSQVTDSERVVYNEKVGVVEPVLEKIMLELAPRKLQAYLGHPNPLIRKATIVSISKSGRLALLPHLHSLENDSSSEVKKAATLAVRQLSQLEKIQKQQTALAK